MLLLESVDQLSHAATATKSRAQLARLVGQTRIRSPRSRGRSSSSGDDGDLILGDLARNVGDHRIPLFVSIGGSQTQRSLLANSWKFSEKIVLGSLSVISRAPMRMWGGDDSGEWGWGDECGWATLDYGRSRASTARVCPELLYAYRHLG